VHLPVTTAETSAHKIAGWKPALQPDVAPASLPAALSSTLDLVEILCGGKEKRQSTIWLDGLPSIFEKIG